MTSAGTVLSQPPSSTAPSIGLERSSSSVPSRGVAIIIVAGLHEGLASDIAGISTGKPPACQTPPLISFGALAQVAMARVMSLHIDDDR